MAGGPFFLKHSEALWLGLLQKEQTCCHGQDGAEQPLPLKLLQAPAFAPFLGPASGWKIDEDEDYANGRDCLPSKAAMTDSVEWGEASARTSWQSHQ